MDEHLARRTKTVATAIAKLTENEKDQLYEAANTGPEGGGPLKEPFLSKAVGLELAFRSTGRLRTDVYKMYLDGGVLVG